MTLKEWKHEWKHCRKCVLGRRCRRHVLFRGDIPCDLLLIGEAPGISEDILGKPFVGPSGEVIDAAVERAFADEPFSPRICIANVICCLPHDGDREIRQPSKEEAEKCAPHLQQLEVLADPKCVIFLGKVAKERYQTERPSLSVPHPATVVRTYRFKRSYYFERIVQGLKKGYECEEIQIIE